MAAPVPRPSFSDPTRPSFRPHLSHCGGGPIPGRPGRVTSRFSEVRRAIRPEASTLNPACPCDAMSPLWWLVRLDDIVSDVWIEGYKCRPKLEADLWNVWGHQKYDEQARNRQEPGNLLERIPDRVLPRLRWRARSFFYFATPDEKRKNRNPGGCLKLDLSGKQSPVFIVQCC